jgi:protein-S-isoprenylcysteine O-methyltransferase Ste14
MILRMVTQTAIWLLALALLLCTGAGTWAWPQAWAFIAEIAFFSYGMGFWLARSDPALLAARMSFRTYPDQKQWDRIFVLTALPCFLAWFVFMGVDARRFAWSHVPVSLEYVGAVLIALCMGLNVAIFAVNSFAVPQIRIQAGRAQHIITTGPYAFVRHPMYASALLFLLGAPLLLGSAWGTLMLPIGALAFGCRTGGEEQTLRTAFPDYATYAARVKYRLIPGLW